MSYMWWMYALLSALFAAITAITLKTGLKDVDTNLATAIRTLLITILAWIIVITGNYRTSVHSISRRSLVFLVLSALATWISWWCYFKGLKIGQVAKVESVDKLSLVMTIILAGIFLGDKITWPVMIGCVLMTIGAILISK